MSEQQVDLLTRIEQFGDHLTDKILSLLDANSLYSASRVSKSWRNIIRRGRIWKKLIEKNVASDEVWAHIVESKGLLSTDLDETLYEKIYSDFLACIRGLDDRWKNGRCTRRELVALEYGWSGDIKFALHTDDEFASCYRYSKADNWLKIFSRGAKVCKKSFKLPPCYLNCLQFDDRMIIYGCRDGHIHICDRNDPDNSGPCNVLEAHTSRVSALKFNTNMMVSCSAGDSRNSPNLKIWNIISPGEVTLRRSSVVQQSFSNLEDPPCYIDLDGKFIVCGFYAGIIQVWDSMTTDFLRTIDNPSLTLKSFDYKDGLIAASYGNKIILWNVESGQCLRDLDLSNYGPIKLNSRRLVFAYDMEYADSGKYLRLRFMDLKTVLDNNIPGRTLEVNFQKSTVELPKRASLADIRFNGLQIQCLFHYGKCRPIIFDFRLPKSNV